MSLVSCGLDLYLLENPFYGWRRISSSPSLETFSDHVLMNLGSVWEARALLEYLRGFYERLTVTGYSIGGTHGGPYGSRVSVSSGMRRAGHRRFGSPHLYEGAALLECGPARPFGSMGQQLGAKERLRRLIEAADVTRQPPPMRTDAAFVVGCTKDGYVLASEVERLHRHWPGSTLRWLSAGHITGLVFSRAALCNAVADATAKL